MVKSKDIQNRARGMLLGLAIGDALGAPVEFCKSPVVSAEMHKIRHMHDSSACPKGVWTDDTSMALCLADSLLECGGYNSYNVMDKYLNWCLHGYRSFFDFGCGIGIQTRQALQDYREHPTIKKDAEYTDRAGNGTLMRLAPVVIATHKNPDLEMVRISALETHLCHEIEAVTEMFANTLYAALSGLSKDEIAQATFNDLTSPELNQIKDKNKPAINRYKDRKGTELKDLGGYCVDTLAIALWGLTSFDDFQYGMLGVLALGGDTDTNGAVYGQLAGAYYGYDAIPEEWRKDVYQGSELIKIADDLYRIKKCPILETRFEEI